MNDYAPRPGDIGLVNIKGHVGRLIRLGQALNGDGFADFQHAYVVISGGVEPSIVEAEPGGARLAPLSQYDGRKSVFLRCPDEFRDAVSAAAISLLGTPYSFADYVSLAARRLHIPAPHLRQFIKDSGHQICSQLADFAAMRGGWTLFDDGRWEGDVVPLDLHHLYLKQELAEAGAP